MHCLTLFPSVPVAEVDARRLGDDTAGDARPRNGSHHPAQVSPGPAVCIPRAEGQSGQGDKVIVRLRVKSRSSGARYCGFTPQSITVHDTSSWRTEQLHHHASYIFP